MTKARTGHERIAERNIRGAFDYIVGGYFNMKMDGDERDLPTIEEAKAEVYDCAMADDYRDIGCVRGNNAPKEMRFATTEWCKTLIDELFENDGDVEWIWGCEEEETKTQTQERIEEAKNYQEAQCGARIESIKTEMKDLHEEYHLMRNLLDSGDRFSTVEMKRFIRMMKKTLDRIDFECNELATNRRMIEVMNGIGNWITEEQEAE